MPSHIGRMRCEFLPANVLALSGVAETVPCVPGLKSPGKNAVVMERNDRMKIRGFAGGAQSGCVYVTYGGLGVVRNCDGRSCSWSRKVALRNDPVREFSRSLF